MTRAKIVFKDGIVGSITCSSKNVEWDLNKEYLYIKTNAIKLTIPAGKIKPIEEIE